MVEEFSRPFPSVFIPSAEVAARRLLSCVAAVLEIRIVALFGFGAQVLLY